MKKDHLQLPLNETITADIKYPDTIPAEVAAISKVIHLDFLSGGANASTHTGTKIVKNTCVTPVENR